MNELAIRRAIDDAVRDAIGLELATDGQGDIVTFDVRWPEKGDPFDVEEFLEGEPLRENPVDFFVRVLTDHFDGVVIGEDPPFIRIRIGGTLVTLLRLVNPGMRITVSNIQWRISLASIEVVDVFEDGVGISYRSPEGVPQANTIMHDGRVVANG